MVERTVYVGANLQVMVRLVTGEQLQVSVANTSDAVVYERGAPVSVHLPVGDLRILGGSPVVHGAVMQPAHG